MATLTIAANGRVAFPREVLQHLGIKRGEKIEVELLPGGSVILTAAHPARSIEDFVGLLADSATKVATIEDINEATAQGWRHEDNFNG